jgi:nitrous oxidase accessory protein
MVTEHAHCRTAFALVWVLAIPALTRAQQSSVVTVSPRGPVQSISSALRLVASGGEIRVQAGVYKAPMIVVEKPVTIVGREGAVLDGEGSHQIMAIHADDVTVRGLRFRNVGTSFTEDRAAIRVVESSRCRIEDNRIDDAFFGIYLAKSTDCVIARNVLLAHKGSEMLSGNGIHLWSSTGVTIVGNRISGHRDGIYFEFVHGSTVSGNVSERNLRYGLHFMYSDGCNYEKNIFRANGSGVAVMYTRTVRMAGNTFENNSGAAAYGLLFKEISDATLEDNRFLNNTTGLLADGTTRLSVLHNEFRGNGWAVKLDANAQETRFEKNNFAGNTFDVSTNGREMTADFAGNYWDEYKGYDLNKDGIGDVPHRPVRLFSLVVAQHDPALIMLRSPFIMLLDAAERVLPTITPTRVIDTSPRMRWIR